MIVKISVPFIFVKIVWFLQDRCTNCGGEVEVYSAKKAWCKECGYAN